MATENIRGTIRRMNSANAAVWIASGGRIRKDVRRVPIARIARCAAAPATAPQAVATMPYVGSEQHRAQDDPGRVQDRREGVEREPAIGDEDLAERERRREQDLREAVDPEKLDVEILGRGIEPADDEVRQQRRRRGR